VKKSIMQVIGVAIAGAGLLVASAVPAQGATLAMSGTQNCTTQYVIWVRGALVDTSYIGTIVAEAPTGTAFKTVVDYSINAQSNRVTGTWGISVTKAPQGFNVAQTYAYCAVQAA